MGDNPYNMSDARMEKLITKQTKILRSHDVKPGGALKWYAKGKWGSVPKMTITDRGHLVSNVNKLL